VGHCRQCPPWAQGWVASHGGGQGQATVAGRAAAPPAPEKGGA